LVVSPKMRTPQFDKFVRNKFKHPKDSPARGEAQGCAE
jgi:hypothetical protein